MKIPAKNFFQGNQPGRGMSKRSEGGMVTVIFIALLAIMMILVTANSRALFHLRCEVKFMEQQQLKRLNASATNTVSTAIKP
jgi:hypothetical protein